MRALSDDPRRRIEPDATAGSLSPNLRRLLDRMWRLGYGTVRELHVRAGDPLFYPPPIVVRTVRLSEAGPPRRNQANADFTLKREQLAFQRELAAIDTGVIDVIKVHDGLPVGIDINEQP